MRIWPRKGLRRFRACQRQTWSLLLKNDVCLTYEKCFPSCLYHVLVTKKMLPLLTGCVGEGCCLAPASALWLHLCGRSGWTWLPFLSSPWDFKLMKWKKPDLVPTQECTERCSANALGSNCWTQPRFSVVSSSQSLIPRVLLFHMGIAQRCSDLLAYPQKREKNWRIFLGKSNEACPSWWLGVIASFSLGIPFYRGAVSQVHVGLQKSHRVGRALTKTAP